MKYKLFSLFLIIIPFLTLTAQNTTVEKHVINWTEIETWQAEKSSKKVLSFTGAQYPLENDLPYL